MQGTISRSFVDSDQQEVELNPLREKCATSQNFDRDSFTQDLNQVDWQSIIAISIITLMTIENRAL